MTEITKRTLGTPENTYFGLSTDSKPTTNVNSGDAYLELDTGKSAVYSQHNVNPVTNDGWWEV